MKSHPPSVIIKRIAFALFGALLFGGAFILISAVTSPSFSTEGVRRGFVLLGIYGVCMVVLNTVFFAIIERRQRTQDLSFGLIFQALAAFLASAILTTFVGGHLIRFIYPDLNVLGFGQYLLVSFYTMIFGLPVFLYMVVRELWKNALERVREKELTQERLEKELLAARLQALQAQTNPHFLFNALNSIAALIASDPAQAEATVERLAALFRYVTERHDGRWVRIEEEMSIIEDYLAIEKVRFGDRLNCRVFVDPSLLGYRVPPLLLQPLVENAVKHGVAAREDASALEVTVEPADGDKMRMVVRNQGPAPAPEAQWRGIGLTNLRSRCRTLFGDRFRLSLSQEEPGWTKAELEIPSEQAKPLAETSRIADGPSVLGPQTSGPRG